jgi:hypothetical protein
MTYAERKTNIGAMRRLLRSLDDVVAVSQNPLVAELFDVTLDDRAYANLRDAVFHAVEALLPDDRARADAAVHRKRQYEIITRYDLAGSSMQDVIRYLCIERSQFYRERASALEWLSLQIHAFVARAKAEAA